jgi:hypothetical protein
MTHDVSQTLQHAELRVVFTGYNQHRMLNTHAFPGTPF